MSDRHRHKKVGFHPSKEEVTRAEEQLKPRGRPMGEFLRACLVAVAEDPEGVLGRLEPVWPEPRPKGRPPGERKPGGERARRSEGSDGAGRGRAGRMKRPAGGD